MKHHVLLGLILGLLASERLGAGEPPVLFNVTFNPSSSTVTIASTGATPSPIQFATPAFPEGVPTTLDSLQGGFTLINFFPSAITINGTQPTPGPTLSLTVGETNLTLDFMLSAGNINNQSGAELNLGQNLALFSQSSLTPVLFNSGPLSFPVPGTLSFSVDSTSPLFLENNTNPNGNLYKGPLSVYVGDNQAYAGGALIGTYTITVVPEPSTYAAIAGGLGLLVAVLHRRRQRARATAA